MGPIALTSAEAAIQTILTNASISATASLSWGDTTELKSESHDAFMNGLAEHLVQHKAFTDGFRLQEGSFTLTDYPSGNVDNANAHRLYPSLSGTTITADLVGGTIDQTNLNNVVSLDSSTGKSPVLSFVLNSIPAADSSGTTTVTMTLYDGSDATRTNSSSGHAGSNPG